MTMTAQDTADETFRNALARLAVRFPSYGRSLRTGMQHRHAMVFVDAIEAALLAERKAALAEAAAVVHGNRFGHAAFESGDHYYVTWPAWNPKGNLSSDRPAASLARALEAAILALPPEGKGPDDHTPEEET